jgi:hypothetical protein
LASCSTPQCLTGCNNYSAAPAGAACPTQPAFAGFFSPYDNLL